MRVICNIYISKMNYCFGYQKFFFIKAWFNWTLLANVSLPIDRKQLLSAPRNLVCDYRNYLHADFLQRKLEEHVPMKL